MFTYDKQRSIQKLDFILRTFIFLVGGGENFSMSLRYDRVFLGGGGQYCFSITIIKMVDLKSALC